MVLVAVVLVADNSAVALAVVPAAADMPAVGVLVGVLVAEPVVALAVVGFAAAADCPPCYLTSAFLSPQC